MLLRAVLPTMRDNEKRAFEAFRELHPELAVEGLVCGPGADPPDVLCVAPGVRIGVEIAEWIDEWHIAFAKQHEREEDSFREVIDTRSSPPPFANVGNVWIHPRKPLAAQVRGDFRAALFDFLSQSNSGWETFEDPDDPQGVDIHEFPSHPILGEYLLGLDLFSQSRWPSHPETQWIQFPATGGAYDKDTMLTALTEVFAKKCGKYADLHQKENLTQLYLLLFYEQAWFYNPPYDTDAWSFEDVVNALHTAALNNHGPFDKIFLLDALVAKQAMQVWP